MSDESLVLCLYAGGTIGMVRKDEHSGYAPFPSFLTETLRSQSRFHDPNGDSIFSWSNTADRYKAWSDVYTRSPSGTATPLVNEKHSQTKSQSLVAEAARRANPAEHFTPGGPPFAPAVRVKSSAPGGTSTHHALATSLSADGAVLELDLPTLITPRGADGRRVRYAVLEYDPLLDSSDMDIPDWLRLARDIALNYRAFDAFVVLHGTDTMAYTSSALSMLLENLGKAVVLTGAQVPLSQLRNDAIENMLGALTVAGAARIPEVSLFFAGALYRGNRASKASSSQLAAFDSPNFPPLAALGTALVVAWRLVERPRALAPFRAHDSMAADVAVLRLFPGLRAATARACLAPPLAGVVLESFGAGNAPSRPDLLAELRAAADRGVVVVNISQCRHGEVAPIYAAGAALEAAGVVPGGDMTPECALAKLGYLLAKPGLSRAQVRALMAQPLRGELTPRLPPPPSSEAPPDGEPAGMEMLLSHILRDPPPPPHTTPPAPAGDIDDARNASHAPAADAARAALAVLPYLVHRAAAAGDVPALDWHLAALSALPPAAAASSSSSGAAPNRGANETESPLDRTHALHAAAAAGHAGAVRALLGAGASVHARDHAGLSALALAARRGHESCVAALRGAGAYFEGEDVEGS